MNKLYIFGYKKSAWHMCFAISNDGAVLASVMVRRFYEAREALQTDEFIEVYAKHYKNKRYEVSLVPPYRLHNHKGLKSAVNANPTLHGMLD